MVGGSARYYTVTETEGGGRYFTMVPATAEEGGY